MRMDERSYLVATPDLSRPMTIGGTRNPIVTLYFWTFSTHWIKSNLACTYPLQV